MCNERDYCHSGCHTRQLEVHFVALHSLVLIAFTLYIDTWKCRGTCVNGKL